MLELTAAGKSYDANAALRLAAGTSSIAIRYTGIHLAAPERVRYLYKLEGLDKTWIPAGRRRTATYSNLGHGAYRFVVRAEVKDRLSPEAVYSFSILPHYYETWWFRCCAFILAIACMVLGYRLHLRRIRDRFALVLEERARLSREIHDTLVQDFVGISSQLEGVSMSLNGDRSGARRHLDLAMRMARHSLTEARRAVMDLRASALDAQGLTATLQSEARRWAERSDIQVKVQIAGRPVPLSPNMEQNLLRITQEAVTNASKHAHAANVSVRMDVEPRRLRLRIADDGCGFPVPDLFSHAGGHFGLIGMRERAERMRGTLKLESQPDQGTLIEVVVPLP